MQQEPVRAVMGEADRMQAVHELTAGQEQTMLVWKLADLWAGLGGGMVSVAAAPAAGMEGEHQQQAARNQPQLHESMDAAVRFAVLAWSRLVECSAQSFRSQTPTTATLSKRVVHDGIARPQQVAITSAQSGDAHTDNSTCRGKSSSPSKTSFASCETFERMFPATPPMRLHMPVSVCTESTRPSTFFKQPRKKRIREQLRTQKLLS